jgi:radical SAM-linked protein
VFRRSGQSPRSHREIAEDWIDRLESAEVKLPQASGRPRPPIAFAAPMPPSMDAERELADLWLAERQTIDAARETVARTLPPELELLDLYDVWLGAPPLQASVVAADYRVELPEDAPLEAIADAAAKLLSAESIERRRLRGATTVRYDLRPLLEDLSTSAGSPPQIRMRTRISPERGAGRPEEVVLALESMLGRSVAAGATTRERIVLASDHN